MRIRIEIIMGLLLVGLSTARADRRTLSQAYEYATQPAGNLELEIWNDLFPNHGDVSQDIQQRVELEYGITDHLDVSLYHVFDWSEGEGGFDGWRLETRCRFGEKDAWPLDVMVYLEGERPADLAAPFELEEKLILGKDFGPVGVVLNLVGEERLAAGARAGQRAEVDFGVRYEVVPWLRLGVEAYELFRTHDYEPENALYAGPSISVAVGRIWLQLGGARKLTGAETGSLNVRSVLGMNL